MDLRECKKRPEHYEECNNLYCVLSITVIKSMRMKWVRFIMHGTDEKCIQYVFWLENLKGRDHGKTLGCGWVGGLLMLMGDINK
jgi:hypothetical protein